MSVRPGPTRDIEYGYGFIIDHDSRLGRIVGHGGRGHGGSVERDFRVFPRSQLHRDAYLSNYKRGKPSCQRTYQELLPF